MVIIGSGVLGSRVAEASQGSLDRKAGHSEWTEAKNRSEDV